MEAGSKWPKWATLRTQDIRSDILIFPAFATVLADEFGDGLPVAGGTLFEPRCSNETPEIAFRSFPAPTLPPRQLRRERTRLANYPAATLPAGALANPIPADPGDLDWQKFPQAAVAVRLAGIAGRQG
jgi:hypothetical protein